MRRTSLIQGKEYKAVILDNSIQVFARVPKGWQPCSTPKICRSYEDAQYQARSIISLLDGEQIFNKRRSQLFRLHGRGA